MTRHQSRSTDERKERGSDALEQYMQIDLGRLVFWLRKKAHWIVGAAVVGAVLAATYVVVTPPRYTVTSEVLVDPAGLQVVNDDLYGRSDQRDTQLLSVDSKLQTLLSRNVLRRVVERLDLARDEEFVPPPSSLSLGSGSGARFDPTLIALDALKSRVTARRDERSFVITLAVSSRTSEKSVRLSEAIVEEFRAELIAADTEGASRTAHALDARLAELRAGVTQAEEAMEAFRRNNGLRVSNGELVSSRSMSQIDTQLREARERLFAAESRHRELVSGGVDFAAMQSVTLSALRTQYATLRQRADAQSMSLGPRHPRQQAAELELRTLQREIDAELSRLTRAVQNELNQARSVVTALEAEASEVSGDVFSDNEAEIRLRELTREAAARTTIYENFLARSRIATERQQLDSTNIRVISPPLVSRKRSWPPSLSQATVFGAAAGFALGSLGVLVFGIAADMQGTPVQRKRPASPPVRVAANTQVRPVRATPPPASLLSAAPRPATAAQAGYRFSRSRPRADHFPEDPYNNRR